jgi:hypothetical protein
MSHGLNIFVVEVSVMIQTKTRMLYTRQRPTKTASFLVMLPRRRQVLYTEVCIEKQLQSAADGILSSSTHTA